MTLQNQNQEAPLDAVYWSPAVEQYFDAQYLNIALKNKGRFVQVEKQFRRELIKL